MSALYIFNAMAFYPVCPGANYYAIGSPVIPKATLHLSGGKTFTMTAINFSEKNIYIQKVTINGKPLNSPYFGYDELNDGGELVFYMGQKPNKKWEMQVDFNSLNASN